MQAALIEEELFFRAPDSALMAVPVAAGAAGWDAGKPVRCSEDAICLAASTLREYDVAPDGQRFLVISDAVSDGEAAVPLVMVVQHWLEELRRLVPAR